MHDNSNKKSTLPALPIPRLAETEKKLIKWLKPLLSDTQFQTTRQKITAFFSDDGEGPALQQQLLNWQQKHGGSWLKPLWDDMYLSFRGSLPLEMNFSILLNKQGNFQKAELASKISYLLGNYYREIVDKTIAQEKVKGIPLCMSQYDNLFKSSRIPQEQKDCYRVGTFTNKNNHILIAYRNHFYTIPISDEKGVQFDLASIQQAIQQIFQENPKTGQNIGIFTAVDRSTAANVYQTLQQTKVNRQNLQRIHDALALIIFDEEKTEDTLENLFSNSMNRYFDKTIEIIIADNGELGFNFEHYGVDGTVGSTLIQYIQKNLQQELVPTTTNPTKLTPQKLQWDLSTDLNQTLVQLDQHYEQIKAHYTAHLTTFEDFGAEKIKTFGISPDAFFHMALQIAQYRTFETFNSTYEPVALRFFQDGRTGSARATSQEKVDLVSILENSNSNHEERLHAMKNASAAHSKRLRKVQQGNGIERHLFGLQKMAEQNDPTNLPALFQDAGYQKLGYDFLSTSGLILPNLKGWIFGPVVEDGYGISYTIAADAISFTLTNQKENNRHVKIFIEQIIAAMREMQNIVETA